MVGLFIDLFTNLFLLVFIFLFSLQLYDFRSIFVTITLPRLHYTSRHFVVPVVIYSVLYNLPKFFELRIECPASGTNGTENYQNYQNCSLLDMTMAPNDIR